MAASPITLEEAAERLGISTEEFKRRLKTDAAFKVLVPIRDGATLRFKPEKVDELARELGAGSNLENPVVPRAAPAKAPDEPLLFDAAEDDVFSLTADEPPGEPKKPKAGDSSVRLENREPRRPGAGRGDEAVPTEEIPIEFGGAGAVIKPGSSAKLSAPKSSGKLTSDSGKKLTPPGGGDSSEFELSLDADSDDFELKLNPDPTSDEVDLGELPKDRPGGTGRRGGESGILSRAPNDSGRSLEKGKAGPPSTGSNLAGGEKDSDADFELTLDSSAGVSGTRLGGPKSKKVIPDSDSEFELTLDEGGGSSLEHDALDEAGAKGDIFETDFEIPPMEESGSGEVALESSDPDVVVDEDAADAGEDVLLEEDEAPAPAARKGRARKPAPADEDDVDLADVEDDEGGSAASVLKGAKGRRRGEEEDEEDDEELAAAGAGAYRPVPWGPIPALFLLPALLFALVGGLMAYELLQTMWGYQQPQKPTAPLVREIAKAFGMEPTGQ